MIELGKSGSGQIRTNDQDNGYQVITDQGKEEIRVERTRQKSGRHMPGQSRMNRTDGHYEHGIMLGESEQENVESILSTHLCAIGLLCRQSKRRAQEKGGNQCTPFFNGQPPIPQ